MVLSICASVMTNGGHMASALPSGLTITPLSRSALRTAAAFFDSGNSTLDYGAFVKAFTSAAPGSTPGTGGPADRSKPGSTQNGKVQR